MITPQGHYSTASSASAVVTNESEILANVNTFAMCRLVESALVNVSRVESIWKIIVAHFDILSNCKVLAIRQITIEALQTIVLEIFNYRKNNVKKRVGRRSRKNSDVNNSESLGENVSDTSIGEELLPDEGIEEVDENWSDYVWQYTVLIPLADQLKSSHNQDKLAVLKGFEKIIQTCGQQIKNEGWRIIIVTISKSLEHESD